MKNASISYHKALLPENVGNPLIECLPLYEERELKKIWRIKPIFDISERTESKRYRKQCLLRLGTSFCVPLPIYLDLYYKIEEALIENYASKNPLSPTTQHFLHNRDYQNTSIQPKRVFQSQGKVISLLGHSGVGKSTLLERIMLPFEQTYIHEQYQEYDLQGLRQVTHITVQCPSSGSTKTLCRLILNEICRITDREFADASFARRSREQLQELVEMQVRSEFIGIIVIDEIQNLNNTKEGREQLLSFILQLINQSGVTFIFCGNYDAEPLYRATLRHARRAESGGIFKLEPLPFTHWLSFVKVMWRYQWTAIETPLTQSLSTLFYELSAGFIDHTVRIFQRAQKLAIDDDEKITAAILRQAHQLECEYSSAYINSDKINATIPEFEDEIPTPKPTKIEAFEQIKEFIHPEFVNLSTRALEQDINIEGVKLLTNLPPKKSDVKKGVERSGLLKSFEQLAGIS